MELPLPSPQIDSFGGWEAPRTTEAHLKKLVAEGLLQEKIIGDWSVPKSHRNPALWRGEIVLFTSFIERGLGLPTSEFFHGMLCYYDITLTDLNPNSIIQISIFVHLCEAFLGIPPSSSLFCYFFCLKPHPSEKAVALVGGAGFQLRTAPGTEFVKYSLPDTNKFWKTYWFYMCNHDPTVRETTG